MPGSAPYDRKLDWAEQHLVKLEALVAEYEASRPYEVLPGVKEQNQPPRLHFTADPHPDIAFILGDFLYNVRASLDYAMKAIAPSTYRSSANFPIIWQGVWEPIIEGDDDQRRKDKATWQRVTRGIAPDALTILQRHQPTTPARKGRDDSVLAVLNRLRNKDTHLQGNVIMGRLLIPIIASARGLDGQRYEIGVSPREDGTGLDDGADLLGLPEDAVDVKVEGTVAVLVRPGMDELGGYRLSELRPVVLAGTRTVLDQLRSFDAPH